MKCNKSAPLDEAPGLDLPPPSRELYPPNIFVQRNPSHTIGGVRDAIFKAKPRVTSEGTIPGNGFAPAIVRMGRKILIDEPRWFAILHAKQGSAK